MLRRHRLLSAFVLVVLVLTPVWVSLGSALANPGNGSSLFSCAAEWGRQHGAGGLVNSAENLWYSHDQPPTGGAPPRDAIPPVATAASTTGRGAGAIETGAHEGGAQKTGPLGKSPLKPDPVRNGTRRTQPRSSLAIVPLPAPKPIVPLASPALPGEGAWHPAGRLVEGVPAIYEAFLRPDAVHTSLVAGVAWMDTRLLSATLYSGSTIPGGGPYPFTAPVLPGAARRLVAAFNAGFLMSTAEGGYYTDGKRILRPPGRGGVVRRLQQR